MLPIACSRSATFAVTLLLAACQHAAGAGDIRPPAGTGEDAYRNVQRYTDLGLHRTGTEGGTRTADWIAGELRAAGLKVEEQRFEFNQFVPEIAELRKPDGSLVTSFPYWYSGLTSQDGIRASLVDIGSGSAADLAGQDLSGKLALVRVQLAYRAAFVNLAEALKRAQAAGASGVIAAIQGPANLITAANAESEAGLCGLPTLFVGKQDGEALAALAGQTLQFTLAGRYRPGESRNVIATIEGQDDQALIAGTPTNGWFASGSERGGGIGALLTLARLKAQQVKQSGPPAHKLVFVFTGGHEVGFLGLQRFIETNADLIAHTYSYVHLGAGVAGRLYSESTDGGFTAAEGADPARTLYVSENPLLTSLAATQSTAAKLTPVQTVLPSINNPGEQRRMYAIGVPIVSISGTTLFFHTVNDTAETTSAELLDPAVKFYGGVIDGLLAASPDEVRAANTVAKGFARPLPASVCAAPAPRVESVTTRANHD